MLRLVLVFFLILFAGSSLGTAEESVTFIIEIDPNSFDPDTQIRIRIFNQEQLDKSDKISGCTVSYNPQTGQEERTCPDGISPDLPEPENFSFTIDDLHMPVVVPCRTVLSGQPYRLVISGRHRDGCNTAQASIEGIAETSRIELSNLQWAVTQMACPGMNIGQGRELPVSKGIQKEAEVSTPKEFHGEGRSSPGFQGISPPGQTTPE